MKSIFYSLSLLFIITLTVFSCKPTKDSFEINDVSKVKPDTLDKTICPDLFISDIKVLERNKKKMYVEYTIENRGEGPAYLLGKDKGKTDNVSLQVFFSGDDKYNRGDFLAHGFFIEKALKETNGMLEAKKSYVGGVEINIKRKTSFQGNLIFHIDPVQIIDECDETNNYTTVAF